KLDMTVTLPGPETGNEFQGKTVENQWIFTAQSEMVEGVYDESDNEPTKPTENNKDDKEAKIPMVGSVTDQRQMPQTGEMIPYLLYGLGAGSILVGIMLKIKK
ncbi:MAG: hypothetical protein ACTHUW_00640, partial [Senegalia sp. (in: firmicutes)]